MNQNGNRPVEEEFRSSQVYKTLAGAGIPVAEKIARGLGKAAEGIDSALSGFSPTTKRNAPPPNQNGYYQNYRQGPANGPGAPGPQVPPTNKVPPQYRQAPPAYKPPKPPKKKGFYQYGYTAATYSAAQQAKTSQTAAPQYAQPGSVPPQGNNRPPQAAPQYQPPRQPGPAPSQARRPSGVNPAPPPQMPRMKLVRRGSPAKFYLTGAAAVVYALNFPMYEPVHFVFFAAAMLGVFLLTSVLFRGKKQFVPIEPEKPKAEPKKEPEPEEKKSKTGNPEVDKIIDEGSEYLKKLRAANDAIPDESLSECIYRMEKSSADIFRFIGDHPEKAQEIRKFMNYYLPTTLKLLGSYQRLSSQSVKGENITSTLFNIAGMMHTVADAFEKQLDSLFTDEAMDISADITVFETMLKQEGFVEENK